MAAQLAPLPQPLPYLKGRHRPNGLTSPHQRKHVKPARIASVTRPLSDSVTKLVGRIEDNTQDPSTLTRSQRMACLVMLYNGRRRVVDLAELFQVSMGTIERDLKEIRKELGQRAGEWTLEEALGDLMNAGERCYSRAIAQDDPGLAWKIKADMADRLVKWTQQDRGPKGIVITVESVGEGWASLRDQLADCIDPAMTGEVVEQDEDIPALTG